jgi:predicted ATPase
MGHRREAVKLYRTAMKISRETGIVQGHRLIAWPAMFRGELSELESHLDTALNLYDPRRDSALSSGTTVDPRVSMLCARVYQQWLTGFADQASRTSAEAISSARALNHASTLAYTLIIGGANPAAMARDTRMSEELARESMALSEDQGFAMFLPWGRLVLGWAIGRHGKAVEGLVFLRQGLEEIRAGGQKVWLPFYLALLAELCTDSGNIEAALEALDEAKRMAEKTGERGWESEIHRLNGEAYLARDSGSDSQAETCFKAGIETARYQGARMLELRSANSLARLWNGNGRQQEVRELLAPLYDSFTEGFDTPDLRDAKALLNELAQ